jgi:hypothetical protein
MIGKDQAMTDKSENISIRPQPEIWAQVYRLVKAQWRSQNFMTDGVVGRIREKKAPNLPAAVT